MDLDPVCRCNTQDNFLALSVLPAFEPTESSLAFSFDEE
jgi:hypothetical protein